MSIIRIAKVDEIRPGHVAMVFVVCAALAGSCLLTSGPKVDVTPEGKSWSPNSLLQSIVGVLDLNYTQTTAQGVEIKSLVFGIGAALSLLVLGLSVAFPSKTGEQLAADDKVVVDAGGTITTTAQRLTQTQIPPVIAAQLLMGLYVLWSFASIQWSAAQDIAYYGSILLLTMVAWATALGHGLNRPTARASTYGLAVVLVVTAIVAVAYRYERNPTLRASYPIGNPLFLAACLTPGILIAMGLTVTGLTEMTRRPDRKSWSIAIVAIVASAIMGWAFIESGSRGPLVGLLTGWVVWLLLILSRKWRWVGGVIAAAGAVGLGWAFYVQATTGSPGGRDATIRTRLFAWDYALALISERPLLGHGQGSYACLADVKAIQDAESDPIALSARLFHAHHEWLQVLSELGSVGGVLLLASLGMTFTAGVRARSETQSPWTRSVLTALLASLAGLIVGETSGGLRVPGLPIIFYTIVGLIWALSGTTHPEPLPSMSRNGLRGATTAVLCLALAVWIGVAHAEDFRGARDAYEVGAHLRKLEFDKTTERSQSAVQRRLDPYRRLTALELDCAARLQIAQYYLGAVERRLAEASRTSADPGTAFIPSGEDGRAAQQHLLAGMMTLQTLQKKAPGFWGSGQLEAELRMVRSRLLELEGNTEGALHETSAAAHALQRELTRRPFDPLLALRLIELAGPIIPPAEVLTLLARPLRANLLYPDYRRALVQFLTVPEIRTAVDASCLALTNPATSQPAQPLVWAPETLRVAALSRIQERNFADAESLLATAVSLYPIVLPPALLPWADTLAELADAQFFATPGQPERAAATARLAMDAAPDSEPGRSLKQSIQTNLYHYLLAAGREQEVRDSIHAGYPHVTAPSVDAAVGGLYADMCSLFRSRQPAGELPNYAKWVERAAALNPDYELVWRFMADLAFESGDDESAVRYLRRALQTGTNPNLVIAFVQLGLSKRPESAPFQSLHAELIVQYQKEAGTTSQPVQTSDPSP